MPRRRSSCGRYLARHRYQIEVRPLLTFFIAPTDLLCEPHRADAFTDAELRRLATITSAKRRAEYIAGHHLIRLAASHLLGFDSQAEAWVQPENSAPILSQHPCLNFGLSHSTGWVAALVEETAHHAATTAKVGLDIELERDRKNLEQLASYSFTETWLNQHRDQLQSAFFQRWTLCEALVKGSDKTLGTELLRHQRFFTETTNSPGHWLYHGRIAAEQQNHLNLAPYSGMHISLCSQTYQEPKDICGFSFRGDKFFALENIQFSVFKAP